MTETTESREQYTHHRVIEALSEGVQVQFNESAPDEVSTPVLTVSWVGTDGTAGFEDSSGKTYEVEADNESTLAIFWVQDGSPTYYATVETIEILG